MAAFAAKRPARVGAAGRWPVTSPVRHEQDGQRPRGADRTLRSLAEHVDRGAVRRRVGRPQPLGGRPDQHLRSRREPGQVAERVGQRVPVAAGPGREVERIGDRVEELGLAAPPRAPGAPACPGRGHPRAPPPPIAGPGRCGRRGAAAASPLRVHDRERLVVVGGVVAGPVPAGDDPPGTAVALPWCGHRVLPIPPARLPGQEPLHVAEDAAVPRVGVWPAPLDEQQCPAGLRRQGRSGHGRQTAGGRPGRGRCAGAGRAGGRGRRRAARPSWPIRSAPRTAGIPPRAAPRAGPARATAGACGAPAHPTATRPARPAASPARRAAGRRRPRAVHANGRAGTVVTLTTTAVRRRPRVALVLAAFATAPNPSDPLAALEVGDRPEPRSRTAGPRSPSGPPRSTTTTCGPCAGSGSARTASR